MQRLTDIYYQQFGEAPRNIELNTSDVSPTLFEHVEYSQRGVTYFQLGRYEDALADFNHAIELSANSPTREVHITLYGQQPKSDAILYNNRGLLLLTLQRYDEALHDFTRAIEIYPGFALAYENRGHVHRSLQLYEAAMGDYLQAIKLEPEKAGAYLARGTLYAELYQYKNALADMTQAIHLAPHNAAAYFARSTVLLDMQRYEEALADQSRAIELNPDIGDKDQFSTSYAPTSREKPDTVENHFQLGLLHSLDHKYDEAVSSFTHAIGLDPTFSVVYVYRGEAYYHLHQYDEALRDLTDFINTDYPSEYQRALAYYRRGRVYEALNQFDAALADYQEAAHRGNEPATEALERLIAQRFDTTFEAFTAADSPDTMRQALAQFPFMGQADFIHAIEDRITEREPSAEREVLEPRLAWLHQALSEEDSPSPEEVTDETTIDDELPQTAESLEKYRRAIQVDPYNGTNYLMVGLLFLRQHSLREAMPYLAKAVELGDEEEVATAVRFRNQVLFAELLQVDSLSAMKQALADYPYMAEAAFMSFAEQAILTEVPVEFRTEFETRLNWLRELLETAYAGKHTTSALPQQDTVNATYTAEYFYRSGETWYDMQRYEEAISNFTQALHLDPQYVPAYDSRGIAYATLKQYDHALSDFTEAIRLNPHNATTYYNRGTAYLAMNRVEAAVSDYTEAIILDPHYVQAYTNRGIAYEKLERHQEAVEDYTRAINLDPNDPRTYLSIGVVLYNTYAFVECLPYFEKAAELGLSQGAEYADRARQTLAEAAYRAFLKASSYSDMRQAVFHLPFMTGAGFIASIKEIIAQEASTEETPYWEERLAWLRRIATEQASEQ